MCVCKFFIFVFFLHNPHWTGGSIAYRSTVHGYESDHSNGLWLPLTLSRSLSLYHSLYAPYLSFKLNTKQQLENCKLAIWLKHWKSLQPMNETVFYRSEHHNLSIFSAIEEATKYCPIQSDFFFVHILRVLRAYFRMIISQLFTFNLIECKNHVMIIML